MDSPIFFLLFFSHFMWVYSMDLCVCLLACVDAHSYVCRYLTCRGVSQRSISIIIFDLCFSTLFIKTRSLSQYPDLLTQLVLLASLLWEITVPACSQHLYEFWGYGLSSSYLCTSSKFLNHSSISQPLFYLLTLTQEIFSSMV